MTQQNVPVLQVLVQYVHNPGQTLTHPQFPAVSLIYVSLSLSESHTLLCGSLRLQLFPSSLYYSPPLVIVYKLTITIITNSFTSCDATILILAIFYSKRQHHHECTIDTNYNNINTNSNELAKQSKGGVEHVSPGDTASTGQHGRSIRCGSSVGERPSENSSPGGRSLLITRLRLLSDRTTPEARPDPSDSVQDLINFFTVTVYIYNTGP